MMTACGPPPPSPGGGCEAKPETIHLLLLLGGGGGVVEELNGLDTHSVQSIERRTTSSMTKKYSQKNGCENKYS